MTDATPNQTFESALKARADAMADACTRCGKCVEVCPATEAAGLTVQERQEPVEVISGIIDIIRGGREAMPHPKNGPAAACSPATASRPATTASIRASCSTWRGSPCRTGRKMQLAERRAGFDAYRLVARDVAHLSQIQLDDSLLTRLGQGAKGKASREPGAKPDFVFYTGCNVLKTPHIALLALDVMDALDISYEVMGGPSHCCGIVQMRTGDVTTSGRVGESSIDKLSQSNNKTVLSWCPSCQVQFTETTLPTVEKLRGS